MWVGLDPYDGWVKLDFFEPIMVYWIFLNLFGWENHGEKTKTKKKKKKNLEFWNSICCLGLRRTEDIVKAMLTMLDKL